MQSVYELRFQTYCQELGFLPAADYPDGREVDEFDRDAAHFCEFDRLGTVAGYVRLVRTNGQGQFPFEQHCGRAFDDVALPPAARTAEISRLILRQDYRKRRAGGEAEAARTPRNADPLILPKLYRQMFQYSLSNGIDFWYAAMERPLARSLMLMGYPFRQVTPVADYYGPVATFVLDLDELQQRLAVRNPEHLAWLHAGDAEAIPGTMPPQLAPRVEPLPALDVPAFGAHATLPGAGAVAGAWLVPA